MSGLGVERSEVGGAHCSCGQGSEVASGLTSMRIQGGVGTGHVPGPRPTDVVRGAGTHGMFTVAALATPGTHLTDIDRAPEYSRAARI